jgi:hypothetical protein
VFRIKLIVVRGACPFKATGKREVANKASLRTAQSIAEKGSYMSLRAIRE